jgi:protein-S-isoprenylcysteine O-methyltransferase Ste14
MTKKKGHLKVQKVRVSAPILTIVHVLLAILLRNVLPLPLPASAGIQWLGLGLAGFGFVLGWMAMNEFKRARTSNDLQKPGAGLVTSGIYRYTRNPVYLGFVFVLIGFSVSMGTFSGVILAWPLVVLMNKLVINPEEIELVKRFKQQYSVYQSRVRRWL